MRSGRKIICGLAVYLFVGQMIAIDYSDWYIRRCGESAGIADAAYLAIFYPAIFPAMFVWRAVNTPANTRCGKLVP